MFLGDARPVQIGTGLRQVVAASVGREREIVGVAFLQQGRILSVIGQLDELRMREGIGEGILEAELARLEVLLVLFSICVPSY
jgi:hypothetical protein